MYFIYGNEKYFIKQQLNEIQAQAKDSSLVSFYYDDEHGIQELIDLISGNDLFNNKRILVINDLAYLENKITKDEEPWAKELIKTIRNNQNDEIVFVNDNINNEKEIPNNLFTVFLLNEMASKCKRIYAANVDENSLVKIVNQMVTKYCGTIDFQATLALLKKIPNDLFLLDLEIQKLIHENNNINEMMINNSVEDIYTEDTFGFANSFESNDFEIIYKKYKEKIAEGVDISVLIGQVSQLLILANQIYGYKNSNKTLDDLAHDLKLNNYRVKKVSLLLTKYGINKIKNMIKSLGTLDVDIKDGKVDASLGFERFLIKYFIHR